MSSEKCVEKFARCWKNYKNIKVLKFQNDLMKNVGVIAIWILTGWQICQLDPASVKNWIKNSQKVLALGFDSARNFLGFDSAYPGAYGLHVLVSLSQPQYGSWTHRKQLSYRREHMIRSICLIRWSDATYRALWSLDISIAWMVSPGVTSNTSNKIDCDSPLLSTHWTTLYTRPSPVTSPRILSVA